MHKKYFFFDIDGTLLAETDRKMPGSCKVAIQKLKEAGHFVAIATSRPYTLTKDTAKALGFDNYVCDGGDGIIIHDKVIEILPLNLEDCLSLAKETILHNIPIATAISNEDIRYSPNDDFINAVPYIKNAFGFVTKSDFDILSVNAIHKMCIACEKSQEALLPSLKKVPHYRISDDLILVEAIDKYKGIIKMMNYLNAPLEDVVVFGDGLNDMDMFRQAPLSIAMGNGKDELKAIASYITSNASENGIYNACLHFNFFE